jgi:simple sugar transport system permease protein
VKLVRGLEWYLVGIVLTLILMYIISLAGFGLPGLIETGLLAMTPLALAAIGECLNEQAGTVNVGMEGIFLITAVLGVYWAEVFESGLYGLLLGSATGALIGFAFGLVCVYGKANQVIAGMGLNLLALGLGPYLLMSIWAFPGIHVFRHELMFLPQRFSIGGESFSISAVTVASIIIAVLAYLLLHRTLIGIRIRAAGENPIAVDVAGVSVWRIRLLMCIVGGALAGLGGAFMPLGWFGAVVKEISAGRGFIALAAVVFAGLDPLLALAAAFIFGFAEGLAFTVVVTPGVKEIVPFYFVQMAPYAVTLLILVAAIGGKKFPRALGKPYVRE